MTELEFRVRGIPVPQGSTRAFVRGGRAVVVGTRRDLLAWRAAIASSVATAMSDTPPLEGPVAVHLFFRLPRPRSHYLPANGRRPTPELRLDAPEFVAGKPDLDKLVRAALDALTGVVFRDDAQVVRRVVDKRFDETPGVEGRVRTVAA